MNRHEGLFLSPEGGATIAAVRRMVRKASSGPIRGSWSSTPPRDSATRI